MTPFRYWWTSTPSSRPSATSTSTARPDSVPKSTPIAYLAPTVASVTLHLFSSRGPNPLPCRGPGLGHGSLSPARSRRPARACAGSGARGGSRASPLHPVRSRASGTPSPRPSRARSRCRRPRRASGAPREGAVRRDERGGHLRRAQPESLERLDDDLAGRELVVARDLLLAELARHRHRAAEVVRMGRAEGRDRAARLGPARGRGRVGVDDAADLRIPAVEREMGRRVRRRAKVAVEDAPVCRPPPRPAARAAGPRRARRSA